MPKNWCRSPTSIWFLPTFRCPGVDGFELLRRIHAVKEKLPVVAVSARSDQESIYLERGFAAVLRKPFTSGELIGVLRSLFPEDEMLERPAGVCDKAEKATGIGALTAFARDDEEAARQISVRLSRRMRSTSKIGARLSGAAMRRRSGAGPQDDPDLHDAG